MLKKGLAACCVGLLVCLAAVGCGKHGDRPDLGRVTGRVLLDGSPLDIARVTFEPIGIGRQSHGRTNSNGEFELTYLPGVLGAKVGSHQVVVSTNDLIEDPVTGKRQMIPEKVPPAYNKNTTLTVEVKEGKNDFVFELKSDAR